MLSISLVLYIIIVIVFLLNNRGSSSFETIVKIITYTPLYFITTGGIIMALSFREIKKYRYLWIIYFAVLICLEMNFYK